LVAATRIKRPHMMEDNTPRVSVGLPVYNGETYLEEALDSLLAQTYSDFELIISDNASTDRTEKICRAYAIEHKRIRYFRNEVNIGGALNHNRVFELSRGEYFMWAGHDDLRAPEYLQRCVEVLDQNPRIVLCYTKTQDIDAEGRSLPTKHADLAITSPRADERFRDLIRMDHRIEPIYGLIRSRILRKTPLEGQYADCDRVLLGELGLYGPFYEIPEYLFYRRDHPLGSVRVYPSRYQRTAWFEPTKPNTVVFPYNRQFKEYLRSIRRAPLSWYDEILCYLRMVGWLRRNWSKMGYDVVVASKSVVRPIVARFRNRVHR
jgi:glycosyltransferase involved in cell wall biosynthesis